MENGNLAGSLVLVRPDLENDPVRQQGQIGIVTYVDLKNDVFVSFKNGTEGIYTGDALFQLKNREQLFSDLMGNASSLEVKDFKDLYKISLLLDKGRSTDVWQALEIARDNPDIWKGSLVAIENDKAREQVQTLGR
jgi:hypothetical protein